MIFMVKVKLTCMRAGSLYKAIKYSKPLVCIIKSSQRVSADAGLLPQCTVQQLNKILIPYD